jgi:hypothetical protein
MEIGLRGMEIIRTYGGALRIPEEKQLLISTPKNLILSKRLYLVVRSKIPDFVTLLRDLLLLVRSSGFCFGDSFVPS